jgi:hypothetical protein
MTSTLTPTSAGPGTHPVRRQAAMAVALSAALAIILLIRNTNDGPAWRVSLILGTCIALASWLVFGVVVRRALRHDSPVTSARRAVVLGVVTVLSVGVFWMALSPIFAVGALTLAAESHRHGANTRTAKTAAVLAFAGLAASLVLSLVG